MKGREKVKERERRGGGGGESEREKEKKGKGVILSEVVAFLQSPPITETAGDLSSQQPLEIF